METTHIIENFNFDEHLTDCEIIEEVDNWGDIWRHKEKKLSDELMLMLYDSGQASVEYRGDSGGWDNTFLWDEEVAEMFENIGDVKAIDLFEMIYRKRQGQTEIS